MTGYYWDDPDWPERRERNIAHMTLAWEKDWGQLVKGIASRCGITAESALLYLICNKVYWWTEASHELQKKNGELVEGFKPVMEHMRQEIQDLKDDDKWKKPDA